MRGNDKPTLWTHVSLRTSIWEIRSIGTGCLSLTVETVSTNQEMLFGWGLIPGMRGVGMGKGVVIIGKSELTELLWLKGCQSDFG